ncbi:NADH-ubiquinone oxidoreductase-F iron-sulfur binding region domain-containing protein [Falsiroseomonas sp. HW251]|uniref:NADH-ubiquinone oxidoreductase-F iron-sulfur binding region domain-containing protein n=1 Tax=Falsiroseomonas sp. HW251 TaxID=3390998 RepID=UPI003D31C7AD
MVGKEAPASKPVVQGRPRLGPRGRVASDASRDALRAALEAAGQATPRRDLLVEQLHALNDAAGCLREGAIVALAEFHRLAPVEVLEAASFYHHFEILPDDAPAPPRAIIRVCTGLPCMMAGGARPSVPPGARVVAAPCMGACDRAPVATTGFEPEDAAAPPGLDDYLARGGHAALRAARDGRLTPEAMLGAVERAGLRGLGGAGFPAARKWKLALAHPAPRHLVVNADEGEPGTFKDRFCLATDPHRVLEGMLLAARAVGAGECWIYLRDEYPDLRRALIAAIAELRAADPDGPAIHLRRGAGAYICGEETALLESLEGRRGWPRHKPPFPGEAGLFGRPTVVHNVETLWWLPEILATDDGAARYAAAGRRGAQGERFFSVSGRVREPGVKRAPNGVTARELIEEFSGGMAEGHRFVAYLPGGASGGILPADLADLPLDAGSLDTHGCFVGSGAVIVLSDRDDLAAVARNLLGFFRDESCGQCTPCRVGTAKAAALLERREWDRALLRDLAQVMADGSICGLGQAAMNPVRSLLRFFGDSVP